MRVDRENRVTKSTKFMKQSGSRADSERWQATLVVVGSTERAQVGAAAREGGRARVARVREG